MALIACGFVEGDQSDQLVTCGEFPNHACVGKKRKEGIYVIGKR